MKFSAKYISLTLALILYCFITIQAKENLSKNIRFSATTAATAEVEDDFAQLSDESFSNINTQSEITILKKQMQIARQSSNTEEELRIYNRICRNYRYRHISDSLNYYLSKLRQRAFLTQSYEYYSDAMFYQFDNKLRNTDYKSAMSISDTLKALARFSNNKNADFIYKQCQAQLSIHTDSLDKAFEIFTSISSLAKDKDLLFDSKIKYYLRFISFLITTEHQNHALIDQTIDEFEKVIKAQDSRLNSVEKRFAVWDLSLLRLRSALIENDNKKADIYYHNCQQTAHNIRGLRYNSRFVLPAVDYLQRSGLSDSAILLIDSVLYRSNEDAYPLLALKAEVLAHQHKAKEAFTYFQLAKDSLQKSIHNDFQREFTNIRMFKEIQQLELDSHNKKLLQQQKFNSLIIVIVIFLLFFTLVFTRLYYRDLLLKNKLTRSRNELIKEKTELEQSKELLEAAVERAQQSNLKKNLFLTNMSHEIRTPLNSIVGFSELIAQDMDSPESEEAEYVGIIKNNSDLLLKLVNDILDLSKLNSSTMSVELETVNIVECAHNTLQSISKLTREGVKCTFHSYAERIMIVTDRFRLQQILTNLLGNAAKFTRFGSIDLSIIPLQGYLRFQITDTGCGITPENRKKIFDRYEKLDEAVQGSGLGLAICRIIAQRLDGNLFIDPDYNNGTRFIFDHPTAQTSKTVKPV